jgi:CheY-like chemotaxis protein
VVEVHLFHFGSVAMVELPVHPVDRSGTVFRELVKSYRLFPRNGSRATSSPVRRFRPLREGRAAVPTPREAVPVAPKGLIPHRTLSSPVRLLIVDDDPVFRQELGDLLEGDHRVTTAASAAKALEALEQEDFDVVFTDLKMPRQSGLELLREIRRKWPTTLVVLVTGFATVETAVEAMKDGAFDYIRKPFQLAQVHTTLDRAREEFRFRGDRDGAQSPDATARRWAERAGLPVLHLTTRALRPRPGITVIAPDPEQPVRIREQLDAYFADHPQAGVILEGADELFAHHRRADVLEFLTALRKRMEGRGPLLVTFDADALSVDDANDIRAAVAAPRTRSTLDALSNPIRRAVLRRAARGVCSFSDAMHAAALDDSPKLSFHLHKLVEEGLLSHTGEEYRITPVGEESVRLLEKLDAMTPGGATESSAAPMPSHAKR